MLTKTGILSGRAAITHWTYAEAMASRFWDVTVDTDKLIIDAADIITAVGLIAWTDLGLTPIERLLGPMAMIETVRFIVDPPGREQSSYDVFTPRLQHGDAQGPKVQHWLRRIDRHPTTVAAMATHGGLDDQTRRFRRATGFPALEYCQQLRVVEARSMLENYYQLD